MCFSSPSLLCGHSYNKLDGIAKSGVEQPTQGLTQLRSKLLGRKRQYGSQRDNRNEVQSKDTGGTPTHLPGHNAQGNEDEEHVDIVFEGSLHVSPPTLSNRTSEPHLSAEMKNSLLYSVAFMTCHDEAKYRTATLELWSPGVSPGPKRPLSKLWLR